MDHTFHKGSILLHPISIGENTPGIDVIVMNLMPQSPGHNQVHLKEPAPVLCR